MTNNYKQEITNKYINESLGYLLLKAFERDKKSFTNTEIKNLKYFFGKIALQKNSLEEGDYDDMYPTFLSAKKGNVKFMQTIVGNRWSTYCKINQKTDCFYINSENGTENSEVQIMDEGLIQITTNMYKKIEEGLYQSL